MNENPIFFQWIIEAPLIYLKELSYKAGISPNAVQPLIFTMDQEQTEPSRLIFPSLNCPRPEPWLLVLGWLIQKQIPFHLFLSKTQNDQFISIVRLFPQIDNRLLVLIQEICQPHGNEIREISHRIEQAFAMLQG
ncbi:MAG: hypothetical protein HQK77_10500 [Desulfobacterales bacterium]|nr:hypothetical protein [Desulfobacterales bacterium]